MKYAVLSLFVIYCSLHFCDVKELPSFIERCSLSDPVKLEQCLLQRIKDLKPRLVNGIPELKLPPIEPLHIPKLQISTGNGNSVSFDAMLTNLIAYGVKDMQVTKMDIDLDKSKMIFLVQIPKLTIKADYTVKGKVLLFEINAQGLMEGNVTKTHGTTYLDFKVVTKNGKKYLDINGDFKLDQHYEKINLYFHDLIKTNQALTEEVNKAINDNIETLSDEVNPFAFEAIHLLVVGLVNPLFQEYSIDELFTD